MSQYFYSSQIRRYLLQVTRVFSNFFVEFTRDTSGERDLYRVPCRYGDSSRQAQTILQNNSASSMPSTPLITFFITGLDYDRPRIQNPTYVGRSDVRQRAYCEETGEWTTQVGNAFTVERLMPVPYKLSINVDIWTSNTNQKMMIIEQIAPLFNPSLEIQATSNWFDWTTLTVIELVKPTWSSKTIPVGTEDPIDIATFEFDIPIWLSSPLKVKKYGVVEKIIASVYDSESDMIKAIGNGDLLTGTRAEITPYAYKALLIGNRVQALRQNQVVQPSEFSFEPPEPPESDLFWPSIIQMYGTMRTDPSTQDCIRPGISLIAFTQQDGTEVIGTIAYDPFDNRFLLFTIDPSTLPANTLPPIDAVIDPQLVGPNYDLPAEHVGQRYLITKATGSDNGYAVAWSGSSNTPLIANKNDIIEYDGSKWFVAFSANDSHDDIEYVTNISDEVQYKWGGGMYHNWVRSVQNVYAGGDWRLIL